MKKKEQTSLNYLDFIPVLTDKLHTETDDNGIVTIFVEHKGFFYSLTQKLFHKPRFSQIHLDEMGSFIFLLIDGKKTVYDISQMVKEHFGDKAEPLYNRLVQYLKTLEQYNFIEIKKTQA